MVKKKEFFTFNELLEKYDKSSNFKKVGILYEALDYMQQYNGRPKNDCIILAMGYENTGDDEWIKHRTGK